MPRIDVKLALGLRSQEHIFGTEPVFLRRSALSAAGFPQRVRELRDFVMRDLRTDFVLYFLFRSCCGHKWRLTDSNAEQCEFPVTNA